MSIDNRYIIIVGRGMNNNVNGYLNLPERKFIENDKIIYIDYNKNTNPNIISLFNNILYKICDEYKIIDNIIYFDKHIKHLMILFDYSTFPCMIYDETNFSNIISFVKQHMISLEIQVPLEKSEYKVKPYNYFPNFASIFNGFKIENKNGQHYLFDWNIDNSKNNLLFNTISNTNYILITF